MYFLQSKSISSIFILNFGLGVRDLRNKNQKGFTLIELLVVIAIIGLLASVVLLALNSARQKSRDAKRVADIRQLASAMELYFNDNGTYPTASGGTLCSTGTSACSGGAAIGGVALTPTYIGQVPTAPIPADTPCTGAQNTYTWLGNANGNNNVATYGMMFCLGGVTGGYGNGVHTLTQSGIQ